MPKTSSQATALGWTAFQGYFRVIRSGFQGLHGYYKVEGLEGGGSVFFGAGSGLGWRDESGIRKLLELFGWLWATG